MFRVGGRLQGVVPLPTSKSIAQRVLLAAMAAEGTTRVGALPDGEDVLSALSLARSFGGLVEDTVSGSSGPPQQVAIQGRPPAGGRVQAQHWSAGESGTLGRCAAALAGLGLAVWLVFWFNNMNQHAKKVNFW